MEHATHPQHPMTPIELIEAAAELLKHPANTYLTTSRALDRAIDPDGDAPLTPGYQACIAEAEKILCAAFDVATLTAWDSATCNLTPEQRSTQITAALQKISDTTSPHTGWPQIASTPAQEPPPASPARITIVNDPDLWASRGIETAA